MVNIRREYSIIEYPFPVDVGVITFEGREVGYFTKTKLVIFQRLPAEVLKPILFDIVENYKREKAESIPKRFFQTAQRDVIFAVPDDGYLKLIQLTIYALLGSQSALNTLSAMCEGDNEKDPEAEKLLMLVLGTLLGGRRKEVGARNQADTINFLKLIKEIRR